MKRLLIAEDEKKIRQGLVAMVKRSGVYVEEIIECQNGQQAVAILQEKEVDVLFTDIRMPKMDGITLLNALSTMKNMPETVVISGHDDFVYAVEALKCGAREYILKPVNREAIYKIMQQLNQIVEEKKKIAEKIESIDNILEQQLKYILLNTNITQKELKYFEKSFEMHWINNLPYKIFCLHEDVSVPKYMDVVKILLEDNFIILCKDETASDLEIYLKENAIGTSCSYETIQHLRIAYEQSVLTRKYGYMFNKKVLNYNDIPLLENRNTKYKDIMQIVQLIGTERYQDFTQSFEQILGEKVIQNIIYENFEELISAFIQNIEETYRNLIDKIEFREIKYFYKYPTYGDYKKVLEAYLNELHVKIQEIHHNKKSDLKMKEAIAYIEKNYEKDINMAMVSNHISMNYSSFSQIFKEFTGSNFVNYIKQIRVHKAKELLRNTTQKVAKIGYAVGYENEKHFMKVFRSVEGISPTEYRKNSQLTK